MKMLRLVTKQRIGGEDFDRMMKEKFLRVVCECGNELFIWTNRNICTCHRARCLVCRKDNSFLVSMTKVKDGVKARLIIVNDTYEDYLRALKNRECKLSKFVPVEENVE